MGHSMAHVHLIRTTVCVTESKAAADKTSSLAGSSPLQPITSGAVPSRPAPRASSISPAPRASSGSPVPRAPSGSPAPRASPAASHRNSADDGSLNQSASQPTPLRPQRIPSLTDVAAPSSLDDTEKQTTPLRPPRPMRDLTSSIDNARDSVAVAGAQGIPSKGTPSKGTPSKATPSKRARTAAGDSDEAIVLTGEQGIPSKGTPSKVTPSKRARNIAADGGGSEECVLLAAGSTPGKRRKSLLPPTDKLIQVSLLRWSQHALQLNFYEDPETNVANKR